MTTRKKLYCRFCADQKVIEDLLDLNILMEIRNEITEKLSFFNISFVDFSLEGLPEAICNSCYYSLNSAYEFFTKMKLSQAILLSLFSVSLKFEDSIVSGSILSYEETTSMKQETGLEISENVETFEENVVSGFSMENVAVPVPVPDEVRYPENHTICGSWATYPWACRHCNRIFEDVDELRQHSKRAHGMCFSFQCVDCDVAVDSFNAFAEHVREHRDSLNNYCQYCNMKLENGSTNHIAKHTSNPNCSTCGALFSTKTALQKHLNDNYVLEQVDRKKISKRKAPTMRSLQDMFSLGMEKLISDRISNDSWNDYSWVCKYCSTKVSTHDLLRQHVKDVHRKCFGAKCADCTGYNRIPSFEAFIKHVSEHRPSLKAYCQFCNYKFDCDDIIHINKHLDLPHCDTCGEFFQNHTALLKHNAVYNPPKVKRTRLRKRGSAITASDLTCDICQKVAKSVNNLRDHRKVHMERERNFFCDRCGKSFFTKGALTAHIIIHDSPDPQICKICEKGFLTLERLKKHVKTHNAEKPFQCAECHKCFRIKEQLKGHMITHMDLMPYSCQYCEKAFKFRSVLKSHERMHTGSCPYSCNVCKMDFSCWSNCNKHMERKHGTTLASSRLTPHGKVPLAGNSKNSGLKKLVMDGDTKEWTERIMVPRKRGKKTANGISQQELKFEISD